MNKSFSTFFEQLTNKAHVYPPLELYRPIAFADVQNQWKAFCASDSHHKFGIYIHIPFCQRKCSFCYCDTIISSEEEKFTPYMEAIYRELELFSGILGDRRVDSLYLGGGTPTHIGGKHLSKLLETLHSNFTIPKNAFVNIEGTPSSITPEIGELLGLYNTDRVTLGIQSVDEELLNTLNRPQSFDEVKRAVQILRENNIAYINFDLVGGLPQDTAEMFTPNFTNLLSLQPDMVHVYPYTPKPGLPASSDKSKIIESSKTILREHNYRSIKNDGWGLSDESSNWQVRHKIEDGASCLGIGIRARSHIFGRLAYRSHLTKGYQNNLNNGSLPEYRGFSLKLKHQVQRYLMDNLRSGVSIKQFRSLFAGDVNAYLKKYHPEILPLLERNGTDIRTNHLVKSDKQLQQTLFDKQLRSRLYLRHISQPKGWPNSAFEQKKLPEYDLNWIRFLTIKLTKGNTYPPITPRTTVTEKQVQDAWAQYAQAQKKGKASDTAGIYCHVPFCATKCKFCYCYSIQLRDREKMTAYVTALKNQIHSLSPFTKDIRFNTLYFGGGTPSLLPPELLDELLQTIHENFNFTDDFQFNFEGTPQTLGIDGRIPILAQHGVTRLTIGIQSLEKHLLKNMDRTQQSRIAVSNVIEEARHHNIKTINVDVLTGLPDQTMDDFIQTFEEVLSWRPEVMHIYPYQNTEETRYFKEGYRTKEEILPVRRNMMEYAQRRMQQSGYLQAPHESWCLGIEHRNQQDVDKIVSASSVLPLGYVARGHVFGNMTYGTHAQLFQDFMDDEKKSDVYYGYPITTEDDKVRFVISNLKNGFSRVHYQHIFGQDVLEDFWPQMSFLESRKAIRVTATEIVGLMRQSVDAIMYAKIFFSDKYHDLLREQYNDSYEPSHDYHQDLTRLYERSF
jgi:oxygen-independent coproporphyrinogen III oxidase